MKIKRREPLLVQSGLVLGLLAIGNLVGSWSQILRYFFAGLAVLFFIHLDFKLSGKLDIFRSLDHVLGFVSLVD